MLCTVTQAQDSSLGLHYPGENVNHCFLLLRIDNSVARLFFLTKLFIALDELFQKKKKKTIPLAIQVEYQTIYPPNSLFTELSTEFVSLTSETSLLLG